MSEPFDLAWRNVGCLAQGESNGEPGRNRTFNQQIKSLLLCQLSYGPTLEAGSSPPLRDRRANEDPT